MPENEVRIKFESDAQGAERFGIRVEEPKLKLLLGPTKVDSEYVLFTFDYYQQNGYRLPTFNRGIYILNNEPKGDSWEEKINSTEQLRTNDAREIQLMSEIQLIETIKSLFRKLVSITESKVRERVGYSS